MSKQDMNRLASYYFFNSYKSFVDYLLLTDKSSDIYRVLVSKKAIDENNSTLNIDIHNTRYDYNTSERMQNDKLDSKYYTYSNNITMSNTEIEELIDSIREDFAYNHYMVYSSVNEEEGYQTMQNTTFSLCIKLYTKEEIDKALAINEAINCNKSRRHKVLRQD